MAGSRISQPGLPALTRRQRKCLALWAYDGLTVRSIARKLRISTASVGRHLHRGQEKLSAAGLRMRRRLVRNPTVGSIDLPALDLLSAERIHGIV